jgi:hypothetical protein
MPDISSINEPLMSYESRYHQFVEDHSERFDHVYEDLFLKPHGFFRSYVKKGITAVWIAASSITARRVSPLVID